MTRYARCALLLTAVSLVGCSLPQKRAIWTGRVEPVTVYDRFGSSYEVVGDTVYPEGNPSIPEPYRTFTGVGEYVAKPLLVDRDTNRTNGFPTLDHRSPPWAYLSAGDVVRVKGVMRHAGMVAPDGGRFIGSEHFVANPSEHNGGLVIVIRRWDVQRLGEDVR